MRRQSKMLSVSLLVISLGFGAACGSESAAPGATDDSQPTPATEGAIAAPEETLPVAADPTAQPPASGLAPVPPAAEPTTSSRPPRAPSDAGVTPSPTIGGSAVAGRPSTPEVGAAAPTAEAARRTPPSPRLVQIPSGTSLPLRLTSAVASDTSAVEDRVTARVTRDVEIDDEVVVPEGSTVAGRVTYAQESGRVKGRAGLTVRFYTLTVGERTYDIEAEPLRREAEGTKGKDAQKIGIGAGAGAVVGGLLGGRKGAAIGAAAGGAGGTGVVLATKGEEVRLPAGTAITLRLTAPVAVTPR